MLKDISFDDDETKTEAAEDSDEFVCLIFLFYFFLSCIYQGDGPAGNSFVIRTGRGCVVNSWTDAFRRCARGAIKVNARRLVCQQLLSYECECESPHWG